MATRIEPSLQDVAKADASKSVDAFRTISEVAEDLDIPQHVLRFWETRFSQIKPLKRGGGRRYYRPDDVELLKSIRHLLYSEGYTIKGVQRILKEEGVKAVQQMSRRLQAGQGRAQQAVPSSEHVTDAFEDDDSIEIHNACDHAPMISSSQNHEQVQLDDDHEYDTHLSTSVRDMSHDVHSIKVSSNIAMNLTPLERMQLKDAYDELAECRRMLAGFFERTRHMSEHIERSVA